MIIQVGTNLSESLYNLLSLQRLHGYNSILLTPLLEYLPEVRGLVRSVVPVLRQQATVMLRAGAALHLRAVLPSTALEPVLYVTAVLS